MLSVSRAEPAYELVPEPGGCRRHVLLLHDRDGGTGGRRLECSSSARRLHRISIQAIIRSFIEVALVGDRWSPALLSRGECAAVCRETGLVLLGFDPSPNRLEMPLFVEHHEEVVCLADAIFQTEITG